MKKVLSLLIAALMIFTLFACNAKDKPADSASPSDAPSSAAPATSEAPAAETTAEAAPSTAADPSVNADEIGFFESGVDPQSRDTYNITWAYVYTLMLFEKMTECFKSYEDTLNVKVDTMTTESDIDLYLINIETLAHQGTDGFLIHIDVPTRERIVEVLNETGVPYVSIFNSVRDEDGHSLVPTIGLNQFDAGAATMEWLCSNYQSYWGDIDTSKLGLLNMTLSVSVDLNDRALGAEDVFKKYFPENSGLMITVTEHPVKVQERMLDTILRPQLLRVILK
jgi:ABC-type sugar transport system substrate-binding protein